MKTVIFIDGGKKQRYSYDKLIDNKNGSFTITNVCRVMLSTKSLKSSESGISQQEVQEIADENGLDVRPMSMDNNHYRLLDDYGKFIIDIYFKKKKGFIVKNSILVWRTKTWGVVHNVQELLDVITNEKKLI